MNFPNSFLFYVIWFSSLEVIQWEILEKDCESVVWVWWNVYFHISVKTCESWWSWLLMHCECLRGPVSMHEFQLQCSKKRANGERIESAGKSGTTRPLRPVYAFLDTVLSPLLQYLVMSRGRLEFNCPEVLFTSSITNHYGPVRFPT